jgi:hypothetical protein
MCAAQELRTSKSAVGSANPLSIVSEWWLMSRLLPEQRSATTRESSTWRGSARSQICAASCTTVPKKSREGGLNCAHGGVEGRHDAVAGVLDSMSVNAIVWNPPSWGALTPA